MRTTSPRATLFLLPLVVLGLTRLGTDVAFHLLPTRFAIAAALGAYYGSIAASILWVRWKAPRRGVTPSSAVAPARPAAWRVAIGVVAPVVPVFVFLVRNLGPLPPTVVAGIVAFSLLNASLEEGFWRGVMAELPAPDGVRIFYPASLFAFGHWLIVGAYLPLSTRILWVMVVSAFALGVSWMWFYLRERRLGYVIASHFAIDVFALSARAISFLTRGA